MEISENYRDILKTELANRIANNPSYSLRSMAMQMKVAPSLLSDVLKKKKNLSFERAYEVARALKFDVQKTDYFTTLVQLDGTKSEETRQQLLEKIHSLKPLNRKMALSLDLFKTISDWHHIAMLEMCDTDKGLSVSRAVSLLGISKIDAEMALERLVRIEMLHLDSKNRYRKNESLQMAQSEIPNLALRKFHEQMLKRATQALVSQTPDEKLIGSETFAFDERQLKKANGLLEKCYSDIVKLAAKSKNRNSIYHLGIQLFRLTNKDRT